MSGVRAFMWPSGWLEIGHVGPHWWKLPFSAVSKLRYGLSLPAPSSPESLTLLEEPGNTLVLWRWPNGFMELHGMADWQSFKPLRLDCTDVNTIKLALGQVVES